MRIGIQGQDDRCVPEPFGNDLWILAFGQEQRCAGMTQIVHPNFLRQTCLFQDGLKMPSCKVAGQDRRPDLRRKNKVIVLLGLSQLEALFKLSLTMHLELSNDRSGQLHVAAALRGLWLLQQPSATLSLPKQNRWTYFI